MKILLCFKILSLFRWVSTTNCMYCLGLVTGRVSRYFKSLLHCDFTSSPGGPPPSFKSHLQSFWTALEVWLSSCSQFIKQFYKFAADCKLPMRFKIGWTTGSIILILPQHREEFLLMNPGRALWVSRRTTPRFELKGQQTESLCWKAKFKLFHPLQTMFYAFLQCYWAALSFLSY